MKKKRSFAFFILLVTAATAAVLVTLFFDKSLSYQLRLYSTQIAVNKINSDINTAIAEVLEKADLKCDNFVKIEKDTNGRITAVMSDMMSVNILRNKLEIAVSEVCSRQTYYESHIPIGNLFGNGLLYGRGFDIGIKFRPIGKAVTSMSGDFSETGINQTLYRISFDVNVDIAIVFPFKYIEIPLNIETIIAETVIIGDVPDSFTHFDLNGDITSQDFQGYVEDYMAE